MRESIRGAAAGAAWAAIGDNVRASVAVASIMFLNMAVIVPPRSIQKKYTARK
jgi:hypothetical protein